MTHHIENTHTIELVGDKGTYTAKRTSRSRRYEACVVATVTEQTIELSRAQKAELEVRLVEATATLEAECTRLGMTVEAAETWEREVASKWHKAWFDVAEVVRTTLGKPHAHISQIENQVKAEMVRQGYADPYAPDGPHAINHAAELKNRTTTTLAAWAEPVLGSQVAVSWHLTRANAQKVLGGMDYERARGLALTVRTDFTVTSR